MPQTTKKLLPLLLSTLTLTLSSCTTPTKTLEPDPNQIFQQMYKTVTLATQANGHPETFRWKNESQPFPYQKASWAEVTVFHCEQGTKGKLELTATTYGQNLGTENFPDQVRKVKETWENQGLTVRTVGASTSNKQIAVRLPDGTIVTYMAGLGGESIGAVTQCYVGFTADKSTAITYPAANPKTQTPNPTPTP